MNVCKIKSRVVSNLSMLLFLSIFFNSCRETQEFVGPGICPSSNFEIKNSSLHTLPSTIDLSLNSLPISVTFNEAISWTVTIKGGNGALKNYSGNSAEIAIVWSGEQSGSIFFQDGPVAINFKIACTESIKYTLDIKANNFNNYSTNGKGLLISDFEGNGIIPGPPTGFSPYPDPKGFRTDFGVKSNPLSTPQGLKYFRIAGQNPNSWYSTGFSMGAPLGTYITATDDSKEVYFNALVSSGSNTTTNLNISLSTSHGTYSKSIILKEGNPGMVSYRLSEFEFMGLSLESISTVTALDFALNAATASGQASEANLDFIIFTVGEPFLGK